MLDETSHHLSGATCFSRLDAKDAFWSIHLDEDSSHLTTFNTHHGRYRFLCMPFGLKMPKTSFRYEWTRQQTIYMALSPYMMIYAYLAVLLRSMMNTSCTWCSLQKTMASSLTVLSATSGSLRLLFWCSFHCPGHAARSLQNPSLTRPSYCRLADKVSVLPRPD